MGLEGDAKFTLRELFKKVAPKVPDKEYFEQIKKFKDEQLADMEKDAQDASIPVRW